MKKLFMITMLMFVSLGAHALSMSESTTIGNTHMSYNGTTKGLEHKSSVSDSANAAGTVTTHDETSNKIKSRGTLYGSSDMAFTSSVADHTGLTVVNVSFSGDAIDGSSMSYSDKYKAEGYTDSTFNGSLGTETEHTEYRADGKTDTTVHTRTESSVTGWSQTWGE